MVKRFGFMVKETTPNGNIKECVRYEWSKTLGGAVRKVYQDYPVIDILGLFYA